jgi:polyphosphate kinase 2 (PPK2 family)
VEGRRRVRVAVRQKLKSAAKEIIQKGVKELSDAQELLWASDTYALLVVFQALDAAARTRRSST